MLSFSPNQRFFLYRPATDMRKGFDGLSGLVRSKLKQDLLSGDVFIFVNKRRDRIKLLTWDRTGFVLYYKQLERGTFEIPTAQKPAMELNWSDLIMMLEGIEIKSIKRRKRYKKAS
jgi:transposase